LRMLVNIYVPLINPFLWWCALSPAGLMVLSVVDTCSPQQGWVVILHATYFADFLTLAQRAFCAAAILASPSAEKWRFFFGAALGATCRGVRLEVVPVSRSLTCSKPAIGIKCCNDFIGLHMQSVSQPTFERPSASHTM
jgi:hypothetical protein